MIPPAVMSAATVGTSADFMPAAAVVTLAAVMSAGPAAAVVARGSIFPQPDSNFVVLLSIPSLTFVVASIYLSVPYQH